MDGILWKALKDQCELIYLGDRWFRLIIHECLQAYYNVVHVWGGWIFIKMGVLSIGFVF